MGGPSPARLLLGYALLFGLPLSVVVFPRTRWARLLYTRVGPSLDPRSMTRASCLRGAAAFAILGSASLAASYGTFLVADAMFGPLRHPLPMEALFFAYFLMGAMGLVASLYLLVRAPFRPAALPTPAPTIRANFLKQYFSADGQVAANIFRLEDGSYAVARNPPGFEGTTPAPSACATLEEAEKAALMLAGYLPNSPHLSG